MKTDYPRCVACGGSGADWLEGIDPKRPGVGWTVHSIVRDLDGALRCIRCSTRDPKKHRDLAREQARAKQKTTRQGELLEDDPFAD